MSDDPYVLPGTNGVLRNKLEIRDAERLKRAEAGFVEDRLADIAIQGPIGPFTFERLCETHRYLFQKKEDDTLLYQWQ